MSWGRLTIATVVIDGLAAFALGLAIRWPVSPDRTDPLQVSHIRKASTKTLVTESVSSFPNTLARPVFLSSRRPFRPPLLPIVIPGPLQVRPDALLAWDPAAAMKGVAIAGARRRAFIATGTGLKGNWIAEGGFVMGWILKSVESNKATLVRGDQKVDLNLYENTRSR